MGIDYMITLKGRESRSHATATPQKSHKRPQSLRGVYKPNKWSRTRTRITASVARDAGDFQGTGHSCPRHCCSQSHPSWGYNLSPALRDCMCLTTTAKAI